jgi:integrase
MGPHLMRRPPKYVQGFIDRHGKPRFYVRRTGSKSVALPGLPWSPEFMAAYSEALAGQPLQPGSGLSARPGSLWALTISYFQSADFRSMQPRTQRVYRNMIERFCEQQDKDGHKFGDKPATTLRREHIVRLMAAKADKPEAANMLRRVLRAMMKCAVDIGMRADDPTRDVKALQSKTDGFHSWTEAEIEEFEATHPSGTRARLAFALLLYTGQRRSDVVRMGRQHVRDGFINVRQQKTRAELAIPLHPELLATLSKTPKENLTFLTTQFGQPFTSNGFGNWFREQCNAAGLPGCSAHGLRKAAARRLAEAGCTAHEIAAITGHASLKQVTHYTKAADQRRLASAAMEKAKTRTSTVKPLSKFDKKGKKSVTNQRPLSAMVPRGGLKESRYVKYLSCPTLLPRSIEFQGLFSRLSHRLSAEFRFPIWESNHRQG